MDAFGQSIRPREILKITQRTSDELLIGAPINRNS